MKKRVYNVPFIGDVMQPRNRYYAYGGGVVLRKSDAYFLDKLVFVDYLSSNRMKFQSEYSGIMYLVFVSDFVKMALENKTNGKTLDGMFEFVNKGGALGVRLFTQTVLDYRK